jgi:hypothetical protein
MNLVLHIPDDFAEQLSAGGDVERQALEALALESYRAGRLTKAELRRLLGIESRYALDGFLKAHDVYEPYTLEDLERERATFQRLGL